MIAGYRPPDGTFLCRDAIGFYSHVLSLIYLYNNECDTIYFTGDVNSRSGEEMDFIPGVDNVPERKGLDF